MNTQQAKHYLLSFPEDAFVNWYNDICVNPHGDYSYAKIERNTPENVWNKVKEIGLTPEGFINICKAKNSAYCEDDSYFFVAEFLLSFNTIEELLSIPEVCYYVVSEFLEEEGDNMEILEKLR